MNKIRVVFYSNQLSLGGTERSMELFCKYLDKSRFDIYVVTRRHKDPLLKTLKIEIGSLLGIKPARAKKHLGKLRHARLPNFEKILGAEKIVFAEDENDLREKLLKINPDVLHVWYSGNAEPPTSDEVLMSKLHATITTNAFELENTAAAHRLVKKYFFMSHWLLTQKATWAKDDPRAGYFYCPIEKPLTNENLRKELGIPDTAFVIGRVGRPDPGIHDPIALQAYKEIEDDNTYFIALAAPANMIEQAKTLGLKHFIAIPSTADEMRLSKFYNTIDVLAHARRDGETFGCNIAEAMIHGKTVVSHRSEFMNAQEEVIADTGFITEIGDWKNYATKLKLLKTNPSLRQDLASRAQKRALETFEVSLLTKDLEKIYKELSQ